MAGGATRLRGRRGIGGGALAVFATACLAVLALTFLLGVLVGRQWAHRTSTADSARVTGAPASSGARSRARRLSEREAEEPASQIQEKLTFYQTLTAPLTAGPPPQRTRAESARGGPAPASAPARPGAVADAGYTIQVAAFRSRAQADKLRETLGGEAYVAEIGAGHGAPFRVRVGSFASRAEAEARAVRLRTELPLGAFVTQK